MLRTTIMKCINNMRDSLSNKTKPKMWLICPLDSAPYLWYGIRKPVSSRDSWYKMTDDMWTVFKAGRQLSDTKLPDEPIVKCNNNCDECCQYTSGCGAYSNSYWYYLVCQNCEQIKVFLIKDSRNSNVVHNTQASQSTKHKTVVAVIHFPPTPFAK